MVKRQINCKSIEDFLNLYYMNYDIIKELAVFCHHPYFEDGELNMKTQRVYSFEQGCRFFLKCKLSYILNIGNNIQLIKELKEGIEPDNIDLIEKELIEEADKAKFASALASFLIKFSLEMNSKYSTYNFEIPCISAEDFNILLNRYGLKITLK